MKKVIIFGMVVLTVPASALAYTCTPVDHTSTIATKHIKEFSLELGDHEITLNKLDFGDAMDSSGKMCGEKQAPAGPVVIESSNNSARTQPLMNMDAYKADSANPMRTNTCFVSFNVYLPKNADSKNRFTARITWSDTDGDFPSDAKGKYVPGGDSYSCSR